MDKMICRRCNSRIFLDRVFTDNKNYETYCIMCGDRKFIQKDSPFGLWLARMEKKRLRAAV